MKLKVESVRLVEHGIEVKFEGLGHLFLSKSLLISMFKNGRPVRHDRVVPSNQVYGR